jgi:hypothetical protein
VDLMYLSPQMAKPDEWTNFEEAINLKAECELSDGMVRIRCVFGEKSAVIGGLDARWLARQLLSEMAGDPSSADVPYWEGLSLAIEALKEKVCVLQGERMISGVNEKFAPGYQSIHYSHSKLNGVSSARCEMT